MRLTACFQLIMGAAYIGAAVVLYPLLREHGGTLALGFLGLRLIAGALVPVGTVVLLLLLALSEEYVSGDPNARARLRAVGGLLRRARDVTNHVAMVVMLCLGGVPLYWLLLEAELVPRWLSVWGLGGVVLALAGSVLVLSGVSEVRSKAYTLLTFPIAAQEAVLAIWLISRGFDLPTGDALHP